MRTECETPASDAEGFPVAGREPLIGVRAWPGAVTSYLLSASEPDADEPDADEPDADEPDADEPDADEPDADEPDADGPDVRETSRTLTVTLSTQCDHWLPGPTDLPASAASLSAAQGQRHQLIRSQLEDPELSVWLLSTLNPGLALPVVDGAASLRRHAAAVELFAAAAATATPPTPTGIVTLGQLLDCYGLLPRQLAAANAELPLSTLLAAGQTLAASDDQSQPAEVPVDTATLAEVASRLSSTPERLLQDNRGLRLAAEPVFALPGIATLPDDARTPYQVRAGDTLATLARRFASTPRAIVAGNAARSAVLPAGIRVKVPVDDAAHVPADDAGETAAASTVTIDGDSFEAVRARLVEQDADITLDAVADSLDRLGAVLAAGTVLSCPLAALDSERDQGGDAEQNDSAAVTAAQIQAEYGCSPASFAAANAAVLGVLQPGVQLSLSGGATTVTTAQRDTLNAVLGRLAAAGFTPSIAQLMSDNASTPLFRSGARALLPPLPVTLSASGHVVGAWTAPAFELAVTLRLERPAPSDVPAASSAPAAELDSAPAPVERADTVVSAPAPGLNGADFGDFVDACLLALPTVRLAADAGDQLWAVSFGSDGISDVRIEAPLPTGAASDSGPRVFALRPLYPDLIDFSVEIRPVTELGSLGVPALRRFHQVDVEPWARSLLADLDRYLREPLNARMPGAVGVQLSGIRRRLAAAVADGLTPLPRDEQQSPAGDAELLSARAALTGIGRSSLASAYASVTAQHRAVTASPYGRDGLASARLHGTVTAPGRADLELSRSRTELGPSEGWCAFALTSVDATNASTVSLRPDQVFDAFELGSPGRGGSSTEPVLLRFVRPLTGGYRPKAVSAELPPVDLPVPLREHPSPPSLQAMTATATFAGPGQPTLDEAAHWTAGLCYTHEHAAQDVVRLSISHAPPATDTAVTGGAAGGAVGGTALAQALAAYTAAAADLAMLIGADFQPPGVDAAAVALRDNAAASLAELAGAVATAWTRHRAGYPVSAEPVSAEPTDCCLLRAVYATDLDGRRLLDRLVVRRAGVEGGWPVITLVNGDEPAPLTPGPVTAGSREYTAADRSAAPGPMTFRLDWPGVRATPRPDARVSVTVERNAELRAGTVTSPALVLRSPVSQVDVPRPCLRWTERLPLTGVDVAEALQNGFDALFGEQPDGYRVSVEVGYAAPVDVPAPAGAAADPDRVLPVLMAPELLLAPDSAATLAATLEAWQADQPAAAGAEWRVRLALLSAPGEPPLLTLDQLVYEIPG